MFNSLDTAYMEASQTPALSVDTIEKLLIKNKHKFAALKGKDMGHIHDYAVEVFRTPDHNWWPALIYMYNNNL